MLEKWYFVADPTLETHQIKLQQWDWISHSSFLMQKLNKFGLVTKMVGRNILVFEVLLPVWTNVTHFRYFLPAGMKLLSWPSRGWTKREQLFEALPAASPPHSFPAPCAAAGGEGTLSSLPTVARPWACPKLGAVGKTLFSWDHHVRNQTPICEPCKSKYSLSSVFISRTAANYDQIQVAKRLDHKITNE